MSIVHQTLQCKGVAKVYFFTEALVLAEFQHVNCMIVRIWEVKRLACYTRAETFTEAVASMVATHLTCNKSHQPLVRNQGHGPKGIYYNFKSRVPNLILNPDHMPCMFKSRMPSCKHNHSGSRSGTESPCKQLYMKIQSFRIQIWN